MNAFGEIHTNGVHLKRRKGAGTREKRCPTGVAVATGPALIDRQRAVRSTPDLHRVLPSADIDRRNAWIRCADPHHLRCWRTGEL